MVCGVVLGERHIFVGLGRRIVCRSEVFCESITDRTVLVMLECVIHVRLF